MAADPCNADVAHAINSNRFASVNAILWSVVASNPLLLPTGIVFDRGVVSRNSITFSCHIYIARTVDGDSVRLINAIR